MDLAAFTAERSQRQDDAIADLAPVVGRWLAGGMKGTELLDATSEVWTKAFTDQMKNVGHHDQLRSFRETIGSALKETETPADPPADTQVARIATWLASAAINDGTAAGFKRAGGLRMRWVSRHDPFVRETHARADGQTRAVGDTFDVGGSKMRYPGDPKAPLSEIMNCRCILAPAGKRRGRVSANDSVTMSALDGASLVINDQQYTLIHGPVVPGTFTTATTNPVVPVDQEPEPQVDDPTDPPEDEPLVDDIGDLIEIPVHGVATIEGAMSGDKRMFSRGAISNRNLPLPLRYEFVGTHGGDTSMVAPVGRLDTLTRKEGDQYNEIRFTGVLITTKEHALEALEGVIDGSLTGVSVEIDNVVMDPDHEAAQSAELEKAMSGEDFDRDLLETSVFSEARVCGFTIVPIPAFQEGFISLGHAFPDELSAEDEATLAACGCAGTDADEIDEADIGLLDDAELEKEMADLVAEAAAFAPGTHDGPGWITNPRATERIRRYWTHGKGAAKIRWGTPGDFNRCRRQLAKYVQNPDWLAGLCANMHKEAIGIWPGQEDGGRGGRHGLQASAAPIFALVAAAPARAPRDFFADPKLTGPTPLHVDLETGHVFGHLATWGVCHIGIPGVCTTAPHSKSDYSYFRTGMTVADDGTEIPVGHLTIATGHASIKASAQAAAAHYDNTGSVVADVAAGEDNFGIWLAGSLRADVDETKARELKAAALSGDWRTIRGNLELVGALAVNVPGFPIPRNALAASGGEQSALVAAGVVQPDDVLTASVPPNADEVAAISRNAVAEYRAQEQARAVKIKALRQKQREDRAARRDEILKGA